MPRPFAYFTGSQIPGTEKYGNLSVGALSKKYNGRYGGARWWNGPDETIGWVLAFAREDNQQPTFIRTDNKTDAEFLSMVNNLSPRRNQTPFTDGVAAKTWLNANGYWTNWVVTPHAICSDENLIVQINDGPIGEPVQPLVTYYGSRSAMIYNSVTPSTYQSGTTNYAVNFTVNSYNFPDDYGKAVNCIASATGETTIGVWDLKSGQSNPNNNVIGVDDQVTAGQMMYPAYLTKSDQASSTPMYGENNPFRPFDLYFTNTDIVAGTGIYARTEIRINSVDANGNDRETQLDQLVGNSGILTFRQNPIFKTNPAASDTDACWYTVENYASYRFDADAFYKVLQSDGSYTYYYSPGAPASNPNQFNQILTSEANMGNSGSWYGQSYNGSLQRAVTPDAGVTTYDGVRPNINVGNIQCNGFTFNVGYYVYDFSFDFPISISIELD